VRTPVAQKKAAAKSAGPQHILRTVFAYPQAVKALGGLNDEQLRSILRKSGGSAAKAAALLRAFRRVAVMLESPSSARVLRVAEAQALYAREHLVAHKEVLPSAELIAALHVTRQALSKAVLANRVFSLDVGGVQYYPHFFPTRVGQAQARARLQDAGRPAGVGEVALLYCAEELARKTHSNRGSEGRDVPGGTKSRSGIRRALAHQPRSWRSALLRGPSRERRSPSPKSIRPSYCGFPVLERRAILRAHGE